MRYRGYAYIRRHDRKQSQSAPAQLTVVTDPAALSGDGLPAAPASTLPEEHPLARRYQQSGVRITNMRDWKAAIQVGGTDLAVA
jgi:hypothetical protein